MHRQLCNTEYVWGKSGIFAIIGLKKSKYHIHMIIYVVNMF